MFWTEANEIFLEFSDFQNISDFLEVEAVVASFIIVL